MSKTTLTAMSSSARSLGGAFLRYTSKLLTYPVFDSAIMRTFIPHFVGFWACTVERIFSPCTLPLPNQYSFLLQECNASGNCGDTCQPRAETCRVDCSCHTNPTLGAWCCESKKIQMIFVKCYMSPLPDYIPYKFNHIVVTMFADKLKRQ